MTQAAKRRTFKTSIDMDQEVRDHMIGLLNQQLADTADLHSQTKQAHWNVKGMEFIALHKLFDELAETIEEHVDEIAERVTALGGTALGTARMAAANSRLPEYPIEITNGREHVEALVERYAAYAASSRAAIDTATDAEDADTADLLTNISRTTDKQLWFLEAHLQG
jgi:starvation-inducible DNA-binding protein